MAILITSDLRALLPPGRLEPGQRFGWRPVDQQAGVRGAAPDNGTGGLELAQEHCQPTAPEAQGASQGPAPGKGSTSGHGVERPN